MSETRSAASGQRVQQPTLGGAEIHDGASWQPPHAPRAAYTTQSAEMHSLSELLHVANMAIGTLNVMHRQNAHERMMPLFARLQQSLAEAGVLTGRICRAAASLDQPDCETTHPPALQPVTEQA